MWSVVPKRGPERGFGLIFMYEKVFEVEEWNFKLMPREPGRLGTALEETLMDSSWAMLHNHPQRTNARERIRITTLETFSFLSFNFSGFLDGYNHPTPAPVFPRLTSTSSTWRIS